MGILIKAVLQRERAMLTWYSGNNGFRVKSNGAIML